MTYAIGQPVRLTKSLSVQVKSGVALPSGASGTVVEVGDKVIVVRFPCLAEREGAVTFYADLRGRLHGDRLHVLHLLRAR